MPSRDLKQLECEFCGNHDTIDVRDPAEKVLPIIAKWKGVIDGDAPPNGGSDTYRWYDTQECLVAGENRHEYQKATKAKEQAELDAKLARANEALKKSGFMDKAAQVAKA